MEDNVIQIEVEDRNQQIAVLHVPTDMNMNLMELLKASGYDILATCGGIALCATCHIEVKSGREHLREPTDQELDMLDTLPDAGYSSRLACQIYPTNENQHLSLKIKGALQ